MDLYKHLKEMWEKELTLSGRIDPASGALTAASLGMSTTPSSLTGKGDLRINGIPTKGEWELKLTRDYVDATVFGDTNKTYLAGMNIADLTYEVSERPTSEFDFTAAEEVYEDDPVALAIISRLESMEKEVALLRDEKAGLIIKEKEARKARDETYQKMYEMRDAKRHIVQWQGDDPVANRRKSRKARNKGR